MKMFLTLLKLINLFLTEEPSACRVEEPFTEKIIMKTTTEDIIAHVREWSLERAADRAVSKEDARAILAEFYEWIEPEGDELEIVSMEPWGLTNPK